MESVLLRLMQPHSEQLVNCKIKFTLNLIRSVFKFKIGNSFTKELSYLLSSYIQEVPLYFSVIYLHPTHSANMPLSPHPLLL